MEWLIAAITLLGLLLALVVTAVVMVGITLLSVLPFIALLPTFIEQARKAEAERLAVWGGVLAELGGEVVGDEGRAQVDGRPLRVRQRVERSNNHTSTYTDVHIDGLAHDLSLQPQGFLSGLFGGTDHEVGDDALDDDLMVGGHESLIGLLGQETRHVLASCPYRYRVEDGSLRLSASGGVRQAEALQDQLQWARRLAASLAATPDELAERLVAGVASDPAAGVRRRFLEVLRDHFPVRAPEAATGALGDPDPDVRVVAASIVGLPDVLLSVIDDATLPERTRLRAVEALPREALEAGLERAMAQPNAPVLWRAAAKRAPEVPTRRAAAALAVLGPMLRPDRWPTGKGPRSRVLLVARAVSKALGQMPPDPGAEELLVSLASADDTEVQQQAITALRDTGTIAAVQALHEVTAQAGILSPMGGYARKAVRAIQARAGGERGGVAVAEGVGGEVAVAERAAAPQRQGVPEG